MCPSIHPERTDIPVLLNTAEAAALLHCSPKTLTVDRCRRRWKVPFLRIGKSIRYNRAAILRWLAERNPGMEATP